MSQIDPVIYRGPDSLFDRILAPDAQSEESVAAIIKRRFIYRRTGLQPLRLIELTKHEQRD